MLHNHPLPGETLLAWRFLLTPVATACPAHTSRARRSASDVLSSPILIPRSMSSCFLLDGRTPWHKSTCWIDLGKSSWEAWRLTAAPRSAEGLATSLEEKDARPLAAWVRCCLDALEGHGFAYRCAFISQNKGVFPCTESVDNDVMQKSIPAQIRKLILYHY